MASEFVLTHDQIEWVYDRYCEGISGARLARALNVSPKTIQRTLARFDGVFPDLLEYPGTQRLNWQTCQPANSDNRLVTYEDGHIGIDFYDKDFGWNYGKVIAWAKLPPPYKKVEE